MKEIKDRNVCFHCGGNLVWSCDYDFEDLDESMEDDEGNEIKEGIVQILHCSDCGAEVTYKVPIEVEEESEFEKSARYIKNYCKENDCNDCKYYHDGTYNIYGCRFRNSNPCDWKI